MPTNNKEYMRNYMKKYQALNSDKIECELCGAKIKSYNKYVHRNSQKHKMAEKVKCNAQLEILYKLKTYQLKKSCVLSLM